MDALVVKVGMDSSAFRTDTETARQQVTRFATTVQDTGTKLATLRNQIRETGDATKEQAAEVKNLEAAYKSASKAMQEAALDHKRLSELQPPSNGPIRIIRDPVGQRRELPPAPRPQPAPKPTGEPEEGHGSGRMAGLEAGHSIRSIFDMVGSGASFSQASMTEMPRLLQAAGKGLGVSIGVEAAASIIKGVGEALERAREVRKAFTEVMGGPGMGVASQGGLHRNIDELAAAREKLTPDPNAWMPIGQQLYKYVSMGVAKISGQKTESDENDDKIEALEQRRIQLSNELVKRKADTAALDRRAAAEGEDAVAVDRERLALRERIAAVVEDKNMDATAQARMIDLLREESKLREDHIQQVKAQHAAEEEARHTNAVDRNNGNDTQVSKAEAALKEAKAKRDALVQGSPEWRAANDELKNRRADVRDARQQTAERDVQRGDAMDDARARGSQAEKERDRLNRRGVDIAEQLNVQSPTYERNAEKRKDLEKDQAENQGQLRSLAHSDTQRGFDIRKEDIQAGEGRGSAEKLRSINALLGVNRDERADNESHEQDAQRASHLNAEAAELLRKKQEILATDRESLTALQDQTEELQRHATVAQPTGADKEESIDRKTARDVQKMSDQGRPQAEIDARKAEGAASRFDAEVDEEMMTPAQKRKRARENLRRQQAAERVRSREQAHANAVDANSSNFDDFFRGPGRHAIGAQPNRQPGVQPNRQPDANAGTTAHADAMKNGFKGSLGTVESLLTQVKQVLDTKLDYKMRA